MTCQQRLPSNAFGDTSVAASLRRGGNRLIILVFASVPALPCVPIVGYFNNGPVLPGQRSAILGAGLVRYRPLLFVRPVTMCEVGDGCDRPEA